MYWGSKLLGSKRVLVTGTSWPRLWDAVTLKAVPVSSFSVKGSFIPPSHLARFPRCRLRVTLECGHFAFRKGMPRTTLERLACLVSTENAHKDCADWNQVQKRGRYPSALKKACLEVEGRLLWTLGFTKVHLLATFPVSRACLIFNLSFRTVSILDWSCIWVNYPELIQTPARHVLEDISRTSVHSMGTW